MMTNLGRGRKLRVFLEVASQIRAEVWKTEICNGLDPTMVARTLTERGMFQRVGDGFQPVRKIDGANKRVYVVTAKIFGAAMKADLAAKLGNAMRGSSPKNRRSWRSGRSGGVRYV